MAYTQFYHLGHKLLETLREHPDRICQIDAATGESETNASVLSRSIRLATSLTALGLRPGDVLAVGGMNHLDLHIPFSAALFNGLPMVGVDSFYRLEEIKSVLKMTCPKVAFCDRKDYDNYVQAARELSLDTKVCRFGDGPHSMNALIEEYGSDTKEEDFRLPEFDLKKVYCWLVCTSGSTGTPKVAALTHSACLKKSLAFVEHFSKLPAYTDVELVGSLGLNISPIQWVTGIFYRVTMPVIGQISLQTSAPLTAEHVIDIINKYRPVSVTTSPAMADGVLTHEKPCDLTCFKVFVVNGTNVRESVMAGLKRRLHKTANLRNLYGQTETMGPSMFPREDSPVISCGAPTPLAQVQLVDPETEAVITEPNVPGELWLKGEFIFAEYYNNPEETAKAFSKDGWFKSGDLMYRDERDNYYYVARIKTLIKNQNYHVVPEELEDVIRTHPGVLDATVTGVPHDRDGEHPLAFVVRKQGSGVTEQEIKDLVAEKLSERKQLRGGVVFLQELPRTSTGKVALMELRKHLPTKNKSVFISISK